MPDRYFHLFQNVGLSSGTMGGLNWTTNIGYPDPLLMNYALVDLEYIEVMNLFMEKILRKEERIIKEAIVLS